MQTKLSVIVLILISLSGFLLAQDSDQPSILISTYSVTQIPADAIYFSLTLSSKSEDPKKAFDDHKKLEQKLLNLFNEFEIADSNVGYSLLYIGKTPAFTKETPGYMTRQVVSLRLDDFIKYEPIQLALLSIGIYEYNAKFIADESDLWIDKGIKEAIVKAKSEAELTAKNSGKKLGEIISIETSHHYPSDAGNAMAISAPRPGETLIDLPHYVEMSVSLRVRFELLEE
ncbi:MAG: SIMPL domain-containing protein [Ignavibacteriota bacterium]|nr:MAG: DUF541 domain-containing protein [Chlorobiota bacterium]MBE7475870.1 SIMPL domain-containing protein [Ignavibacteriales bacterium]MBL1123322.1 DUF541 domain-containing protein [Ignavibacteriota bacterium]MCE7856523.1 DUF541 domain-containing protein [Ignavibacteria bacterium CHB3]MEB2295452.1 SIMPL domain-containing protein [Ignavibacteria bacterium]